MPGLNKPQAPGITPVQASRDVQGSPFGGGGFVDYGGQLGKVVQDQLQYRQDVSDYEKGVRQQESKDVDEKFGGLFEDYEHSTVPNIFASDAEMMKGWKSKFLEAKRRFNETGDQAAYAEMSELSTYPMIYKNSNAALNDFIQMGQEALDNGTMSDSTPIETRDFLQTLLKNPGSVMRKNINGVPYLVGTTAGGKEIQVPLSKIAEGHFKFNTKIDTGQFIDGLATELEGYKQSIQKLDGTLLEGNFAWDNIKGKALSKIDGYLKNESTVRAIAADDLGITADQFESDPEGSRNAVRTHLLNDIQQSYFPTTAIKQRAFKQDVSGAKVDPVDYAGIGSEFSSGDFSSALDRTIQGTGKKGSGKAIVDVSTDGGFLKYSYDTGEVKKTTRKVKSADGSTAEQSVSKPIIETVDVPLNEQNVKKFIYSVYPKAEADKIFANYKFQDTPESILINQGPTTGTDSLGLFN